MSAISNETRWLVTGATGQLGGHVVGQLASRSGATVMAIVRDPDADLPDVAKAIMNLADVAALDHAVREFKPTHVLHIGAVTAVSLAYADPDRAHTINVEATEALARSAAGVGARMVFTSTDMVFDGTAAPYCETDPVAPLSVYGKTKAEAERRLMALPNCLTVRLPLMYGLPQPPRETTFTKQLAALRAGEPLNLFTDEYRTPVWLGDAARALIALAENNETGLIHVTGPERLSRYDLIARVAACLGIENPNLVPTSRKEVATPEPRPADLSLEGEKFNKTFPNSQPNKVDAKQFQ